MVMGKRSVKQIHHVCPPCPGELSPLMMRYDDNCITCCLEVEIRCTCSYHRGDGHEQEDYDTLIHLAER